MGAAARIPATRLGLLQQLLWMAGPIFLSVLVATSLPMVTMLRIGRRSKEELAAAALGSMLCNATAFAAGFGMTSALGPTCGQAFGAQNFAMVGRQCQRMMAILTLFCVPIVFVWVHSGTVIRALGLPLSDLVQTYTRASAWGMWPYFMFDCLRRYLAAQKLTWPITAASVATICTHVAVSDVLVSRHGLAGAGWANAIANWTLFVLLSGLIVAQRCRAGRASPPHMHAAGPRAGAACGTKMKTSDGDGTLLLRASASHPDAGGAPKSVLLLTWPSPFSREVFRGWTPLLELGAPSAVSMLIEWGGFELNAVLAGRMGIKELATHSIFAQYSTMFYALPNGVAQAAATLGSNALGAGDADTVQRLVPLAYGCCILCGVLQGGAAFSNRRQMGLLFSKDAEVVRMTSDIAPVFCLAYEIADVWKCAGMLYLRETGRPSICAQAAGGSIILFGLPLSYTMSMRWGYGLAGVWLGAAAGWLLCGTVFAIVLCRTDWDKEVRKVTAVQCQGKPPSHRQAKLALEPTTSWDVL